MSAPATSPTMVSPDGRREEIAIIDPQRPDSHRSDAPAARCLWCRRNLPEAKPSGRPRRYCRQSCRQRAYEARRHAEELGLSDEQLVITRAELERMYDLAYHLQGVVSDTDRSLSANPHSEHTPEELSELLTELLAACRPLVDQPLL